MSSTKETKLDHWIANSLGRSHALVSRRSFASRVVRATFAVLGVVVADKAGLFKIPYVSEAKAAGVPSWQRCGLRGHICGTGNCDCPVPGATRCGIGAGAVSRWVSCCEDDAKCFHCCTYQDKTSDVRPPASSGCDGVRPNGPQWGGNTTGNAIYVCTIISCGPTIGKTKADCNCTGYPDCGI